MTNNAIDTSHPLLQTVTTSLSTVQTCSTVIPADDTIPQITEGDQVLTLSITPKYSTSTLEIKFSSIVTKDTNAGFITTALFQDSTANAISAGCYAVTASSALTANLHYVMTSGTTSSTTFKIRIGPGANNCYVNGDASGNQLMGGVSSTRLTINEYL